MEANNKSKFAWGHMLHKNIHRKEEATVHHQSFIYAYELMICLHVFCQTGPPWLVDCLVPLPVCYIEMEASCLMPCPRTHQASLPACSTHCPFCKHLAGKLWIPFFKVFWYDLTLGKWTSGLLTTKHMLLLLRHHASCKILPFAMQSKLVFQT